MTLQEIKQVLATEGLFPNKKLGQNFLYDQNLCQWIASQATINAQETVWEIGPGLGALTDYLLELAHRVEAVEVDRGFVRYLKKRWGAHEKFSLHECDALEFVPHFLPASVSCVMGNLPYSIATPLLAAFLEKKLPPQRMIFTVQYEMAERLLAEPGSRYYGAISVMVNTVYAVKLLKKIAPNVFYPKPEVFSAVLRLQRKDKIEPYAWRTNFFPWLREAFHHKRKQLTNNLSEQFPLESSWKIFFERQGWNPKLRAEELNFDQWKMLFNYYNNS
ncbi:MAG: 16S rRNA (adenine(1518)-N(6)/adenine(1519)-N(6))-dimethyltransferase RsmA [Verrucomicrobiia bacterium]